MRPRKDYRLPPPPALLSDAVQPENLVVRFLTPAGTPAQSFDLSAHAHRPHLAAELAFAFRHHLADKSDRTRQTFQYNIAWWFRFLDEHDPAREVVRSARDISTATLRAYIAWLDRQPLAIGSRDRVWSAIKQPLAWMRRHRPDLIQAGLELPINAFPRRFEQGCPRAALARTELDAVLSACRADIEASWADFEAGRTLLAARRQAASLVPGELNLKDLGSLLTVLVEQFGGFVPKQCRPYPDDAMYRRVCRTVSEHGGLARISRFLHATAETLVPYAIAIAAQLFANPEALRNLRRDCMVEHVMLDRRWLVTWYKGRARQVQRRSFLRDRGLSVPNLIDRVLALTEPLVPHAPAADRNSLFLCSGIGGLRRIGLITRCYLTTLVHAFAERHGLRGIDGSLLVLTMACFRPTGLALAHAALGYDVTKTQIVASHASADTTRRYVDQPAVRAGQAAGLAQLQGRFVAVVRDGGWATTMGDEVGVDVAPRIDARNATASGFTCSDPLAGIAPGQYKGRLCTAWLGCFTCPNAVIPLEANTLARLLRMRDALAEARSRMALDRWGLLYAPKLEILERDVLPRFPTALRAAASELVGQLPPPPPIE